MNHQKFMGNDSTMQYQARVDKGRDREKEIIKMMKENKFDVVPASNNDDILCGIDCYLTLLGHRWPTQIKVRQSSEDLLFVVTDNNKPGKDMKTKSELYIFFINDYLYFFKTLDVHKTISNLVELMNRQHQQKNGKFKVIYKGVDCELSVHLDPVSGVSKLMAFIPTTLFTDVIDPVMAPYKVS